MLIVEWATAAAKEGYCLPFGAEVMTHIEQYKGFRRQESVSAWKLLYDTAAANGLECGNVVFGKNGKPAFLDNGLYFSLAHSKGVCAAAISDIPVGVDIELYRDDISAHLMEKFLTEAEKTSFDGDYIRLWCRKEALVKMTGYGVTGLPYHIDTSGYAYSDREIEYGGRRYCLTAVTETRTGI